MSDNEKRAFHGAECASYPNCTGGCGLGCTHDVEASRPAMDNEMLKLADELALAADKPELLTTVKLQDVMVRAVRALRAAAASAEPVAWHWRHKAPHNGAPWSDWKRIDGSIDDFRSLWGDHLAGAAGRTIVELRPLYAHPTPDAEIVAALDGIDADYMTSETHHPGYVLIPTAKFDALCAAMKTARAAIWNGCDTVKAVAEIDAALAKAKGGSRT